MAHKYVLDKGWQVLMKDLNIPVQDVLRYAQLPLDLFQQKNITLTSEEYFRLWHGLAYAFRDNPTFPIDMMQAMTVEVFSPPLFACLCSPNLNIALERLAHYKPLIGPLKLDITKTDQLTTVEFSGLPEEADLPTNFIAIELGFKIQIARLATREHIIPAHIYTTIEFEYKEAYEEFFGVSITKADFNGLAFHAYDAQRPFLTANEQMWDMFEPSLNKRMKDLEQGASFTERVRACLMEIMASGQYSMADVASRLAVSPRTLQRRLRSEDTTFQRELDQLREELARNYLMKSEYSSGQIAFLLGYEDPNSFFRAFRNWTGQTPESMRASLIQ